MTYEEVKAIRENRIGEVYDMSKIWYNIRRRRSM